MAGICYCCHRELLMECHRYGEQGGILAHSSGRYFDPADQDFDLFGGHTHILWEPTIVKDSNGDPLDPFDQFEATYLNEWPGKYAFYDKVYSYPWNEDYATRKAYWENWTPGLYPIYPAGTKFVDLGFYSGFYEFGNFVSHGGEVATPFVPHIPPNCFTLYPIEEDATVPRQTIAQPAQSRPLYARAWPGFTRQIDDTVYPPAVGHYTGQVNSVAFGFEQQVPTVPYDFPPEGFIEVPVIKMQQDGNGLYSVKATIDRQNFPITEPENRCKYVDDDLPDPDTGAGGGMVWIPPEEKRFRISFQDTFDVPNGLQNVQREVNVEGIATLLNTNFDPSVNDAWRMDVAVPNQGGNAGTLTSFQMKMNGVDVDYTDYRVIVGVFTLFCEPPPSKTVKIFSHCFISTKWFNAADTLYQPEFTTDYVFSISSIRQDEPAPYCDTIHQQQSPNGCNPIGVFCSPDPFPNSSEPIIFAPFNIEVENACINWID